MIDPSPPPKRRGIPRWMIVTGASMASAAALLWILIANPGWAAPFVEDELVSRLESRFGVPVEVGNLELETDRVQITGLVVGSLPEARLIVDHVEVGIDPGALWRRKLVVTEVRVTGGRVAGTRDGLTALLRRRGAEPTGPRSDPPRHSLRPRTLIATGLAVEVDGAMGPGTRAEGTLDLEAGWPDGAARVDLRRIRLLVGGEREVRAHHAQANLTGVATREGVSFPVDVALRGAAVTLTPEIAVAGVHGKVTLSDSRVERLDIDLAGTFSDSVASEADTGPDLWSAKGHVRRDMTEGELDLRMEAFELRRVPQVLERLPLVRSESATVGGNVAVRFRDGKASTEGDVRLAGLNVSHPLLARGVVEDLGFDLQFEADLDPKAKKVELHRARVDRKGVALEIDGTLVHPAERDARRYDLHLRVPPVPCQTVLAAVPSQLIPSLSGFVLAGNFDLDLKVAVDFSDLEALELGGKVGLTQCKVRNVPAAVSGARLGGPFTHRIVMKDGRERVVRLFSGSRSFTPLTRISPYMVAGVLTTEDGGFFRHRGFLPSQFRTAMKRNLQAGRVRYGASTLTMQMVKNVLLSHERTLSRKLQEMFLTWYVERALTKDRIMEIYLNVVEFGPGLYGITAAADHYFGKDAIDLNPLEAAYLALMLPSPVRRHAHYCRGELTRKFDVKLRRILRYMHERGHITAEEYTPYAEAPLVFSRMGVDEARCLEETRSLLEAGTAQRALSGLLGDGFSGFFGGDDGGDPEVPGGGAEESGAAPLPSVLDGLPGSAAIDPAEADAPGHPAMDPPVQGAPAGQGAW